MKKLLTVVLALVIVFTLCACGSEPAQQTNTHSQNDTVKTEEPKVEESKVEEIVTEAEPDKDDVAYEITYQRAYTYVDSIGTTWISAIVELENTGTDNLYISSCSLDIEDENGKLVTAIEYPSTAPTVFAAGEKAYIYDCTTLDSGAEAGKECTIMPHLKIEKAKVDFVRYEVSELEITVDDFGFLGAKGRAENKTSEDANMPRVDVVLFNANNEPTGIMFTYLEDLVAGDKRGFTVSGISLPDEITADTIASYIAYSYPLQMQF